MRSWAAANEELPVAGRPEFQLVCDPGHGKTRRVCKNKKVAGRWMRSCDASSQKVCATPSSREYENRSCSLRTWRFLLIRPSATFSPTGRRPGCPAGLATGRRWHNLATGRRRYSLRRRRRSYVRHARMMVRTNSQLPKNGYRAMGGHYLYRIWLVPEESTTRFASVIF
jgi:hypothetical protein